MNKNNGNRTAWKNPFDSMSHYAVKACCHPTQACHPSAVTAVTNGCRRNLLEHTFKRLK